MSDGTGHLHSRREQIEALAALPDDGPVVMVNLLKFRPDGGERTYDDYQRKMLPMVKQYGLKIVYQGACEQLLIGGATWDRVLLVEYPSRRAFLEMVTSAEYQEISETRTAALEDSVLYATRPK